MRPAKPKLYVAPLAMAHNLNMPPYRLIAKSVKTFQVHVASAIPQGQNVHPATRGSTTRSANLIATGRPGTLQIRDGSYHQQYARGLGACTGDSGALVFEDENGRAIIVSLVSWSTGPNSSDGCGRLNKGCLAGTSQYLNY